MFALFAFVFLIVLFVFSWFQKNRPMGHYAWPLCLGKHWPLGKKVVLKTFQKAEHSCGIPSPETGHLIGDRGQDGAGGVKNLKKIHEKSRNFLDFTPVFELQLLLDSKI